MLNWKVCFTVAICCFVGAWMLPNEYAYLTTNAPLPEPPVIKQSFDFTTFMLYLMGGGFGIAGIIELVRSRDNPS